MGRAPCCSKVGLNRGPWTPEEDMLLNKHIEQHGEGNWRALPKAAGLLRCGKSCRLRWVNYLRPNVKRGNISEDEEDLIVMLHALLGNRWSLIAARMPGRTDNEIKNYWNTHLSKKLASRGLDPKTHKPLAAKPANSPAKKGDEDSSSSSQQAPAGGSGDLQEAWETTMDLDTVSYSTGSCEDDHRHRDRALPPPKVCARLHKKRQMPVLAALGKESSASPLPGAMVDATADASKRKNNFDYPSPSSVLNVYSPSPSASMNSQCLSNSGSHCDSPTISKSASTDSQRQQRDLAAVSASQHWVDSWNQGDPEPVLRAPDADQVEMLDCIDEFLLRKDEGVAMVGELPAAHGADLFKEDGGIEFWESLGKIELDSSSVCQSDLWEGLTDFVMPPGNASLHHHSSIPVSQPQLLLSCSNSHSSSSSSSSAVANFLHDELLFC